MWNRTLHFYVNYLFELSYSDQTVGLKLIWFIQFKKRKTKKKRHERQPFLQSVGVLTALMLGFSNKTSPIAEGTFSTLQAGFNFSITAQIFEIAQNTVFKILHSQNRALTEENSRTTAQNSTAVAVSFLPKQELTKNK